MSLPHDFTKEFTNVEMSKLHDNFSYFEQLSGGYIQQNDWLFSTYQNIITPITTPAGIDPASIAFENAAVNYWQVPAGITSIFVKMWGAGGGGGSYGGWRQGGLGGAGGYSHAIVPVVPGEIITVRPGGPGLAVPGTAKGFPDGGGASPSGGDNRYCASGGGSSSILVPSISSTAYCMFAGGGGGGGACNGYAVHSGGAGGGLRGQPGFSTAYTEVSGPQWGGGGGIIVGGSAGVGSNNPGAAGTFNQGATHPSANCYGGGGGGGYWGGGAGAYGNGNSMGGGGGGSGYIHPSLIMGVTLAGSGSKPAQSDDPVITARLKQYAMGAEEGGHGGPGYIVFYY